MPVESPTTKSHETRPHGCETRSPESHRDIDPYGDPKAAAHRVRRALKTRLGDHKYRMWFEHTSVTVDDARLEVTASNAYVYKWIESHFAEDLECIAHDSLGRAAHVDLRVAEGGDPNTNGAPMPGRGAHEAHVNVSTEQVSPARGSGTRASDALGSDALASDAHASPARGPATHSASAHGSAAHTIAANGTHAGGPLAEAGRAPADARYRNAMRRGSLRRLDEFVVGESNRLAYSTACRLLEAADAQGVSPLFIHGECGLGKTHLLQGICRRFQAMSGRPGDVRYVTGEQFTNEYITSIRKNTVDAFRRRVRKLDLLAIDDVHFLSNKVRTQGEFLHTLDAIDLTGARVVLASDEHPRVIKRFSHALVSRFLSGMVVQIDRPDRETRIAIVRRLAAARSLPISHAATEAVASRCVASVRELEGAVTKLAALWTLASNDNGTAPAESGADEAGIVLVEQLFKDHGWQPPVPVRIGTVIDTVCRRTGIGRPDLMGTSRHRRVVLARALVAYLGRSLTTLSYPELARAIGRPYHSTVHTAEQRLRRQLAAREHVQAGDAQEPIPLTELVDQLRHEISRATARKPSSS